MSQNSKNVTKESKSYPHYSQAWENVRERMNHLQGRVLTLVDASVADPIQRKALKDLIKQDFNNVEFLDSWSLREIVVQVAQRISSEYGDPCFQDADLCIPLPRTGNPIS